MQLEAALSVARELALEAVADKLGLEVSDDEVKALVREQAEAAGEDADNVIEDLWNHGRQEDLREDLRLRAALDRVAAEVKPIPMEQAQAREAIWTPDKEKPETETKLWTPSARRLHEPVDPDGDRADIARRAIVRHLLPLAERADRLSSAPRSTTRSRT
jgi:hypothetical protein